MNAIKKEPYTKPPLTYKQQLELLEKRGLIISSSPRAEAFLSQVNYYHFSAYCLPFEATRHRFKTGIAFESIQQLYEFDRRLRFLLDEALEIIEISIRTKISYELTHRYGAFAHEDSNLFVQSFKHKEWIEKIHRETERSKETFIGHYKNKYNEFPKLPLWMAVEVMSFGALSIFYRNLLRDDQIIIAKNFKLHYSVLSSWLHTFTYIRNICAHHCRMWNREIAIAMKMPKVHQWTGINPKRIGSVIFAIRYFLSNLSLENYIKINWDSEIERLLNQKIKVDYFYQSMGLPQDFKNHNLWPLAL